MAPTSTTEGEAGDRLPHRMRAGLVASFAVIGGLQFHLAPRLSFLGDDTWVVGRAATGSAWGDYQHVGTEFFRPLSSLAVWLQHGAFGTAAAGYHVVSVAVHLVNSLLVVALAAAALGGIDREGARRASTRWTRTAAVVAGAVFLVHPSHGEAVYWISAQPDLFAAFFSLLAFLALLGSRRGGAGGRAVPVGAAALALLCKESAAGTLLALAVVATALERSAHGPGGSGDATPRPWGHAGRAALPYAGLGVVYVVVRWAVLGTPVGGYGSGAYTDQSPGDLIAGIGVAAARTVLPSMGSPAWFVAAAIAIAAVGTVLLRSAGLGRVPVPRHTTGALVVTAALTLLPAAPLGVSSAGPLGERNVYGATVFTALLVAVMAVALAARVPRAALAAGVAVALVLGGVGLREGRRWSDASAAADGVTDSLAGTTEGPVLLLNVPDTVRGAIAFRNSAAGLDLYGPRLAALDATVVTTREFGSPDDVDRARLLPDGRTVRVTIADPRPSGPLRPSEVDGGPWTVRLTGPASYDVVLDASVDATSLRFFSGGRLRPVD